MQNGKGDKPRPINKSKYNSNYDLINWKTFKKATRCPTCDGIKLPEEDVCKGCEQDFKLDERP